MSTNKTTPKYKETLGKAININPENIEIDSENNAYGMPIYKVFNPSSKTYRDYLVGTEEEIYDSVLKTVQENIYEYNPEHFIKHNKYLDENDYNSLLKVLETRETSIIQALIDDIDKFLDDVKDIVPIAQRLGGSEKVNGFEQDNLLIYPYN